MSWISSAWHLASRFHISAALSGFHRILCMSAPVGGLLFAAQFPTALRLSAYQHLASDLMISSETPQDEGTIFTQQQLWNLKWWRKLCQRLFWGFLRTGPGRINQLICVVSVCVCVRLVRKKKRWWQRGFFDPSESEEGIKLPVLLSEVTIPRSGVQFHLCRVEIPSSGLICPSVKDAALIRNRLPDVSTYLWIHVSGRLTLPLSVSCGGTVSACACCEIEWHTDIPYQEIALVSAIMCQGDRSSSFRCHDHGTYMLYLAALVVRR